MIDSSEKRKLQLAFELQSSRVFKKRCKSRRVEPFNNLSTLRIPRLVSLVVGLPSGRTWAKTVPFLSRVKCVSTF